MKLEDLELWEGAPIDKEIEDHILRMNEIGMRTFTSCSGVHNVDNPTDTPYVAFHAEDDKLVLDFFRHLHALDQGWMLQHTPGDNYGSDWGIYYYITLPKGLFEGDGTEMHIETVIENKQKGLDALAEALDTYEP